MEDRLLNVTQLSEMTGLSVSTIYQMREGDKIYIKSVKLGKSLRFKLSDVQKFIKDRE